MEYFNLINQEYLDFLSRPSSKYKFKIELLDSYEQTISELTGDISQNVSGSISYSYKQGLRATCTFSIFDPRGEFLPSAISKYFWFRKKFKIYVGLQGENENIYWFSKGIFVIKDLSSQAGTNGRIITINGVDKFGLFGGETGYSELTGTYKIPLKTNLFNATNELLTEDLGNDIPVDPIPPIITPTLKGMESPYDLTKGPGQYMSELLISVANIYGADIFYDSEGHLILSEGTIDNAYSNQGPIWNFSPKKDGFGEPVLNTNFASVINSVYVIGDNIKDKIYISIAEDNNPASSTNVGLIGRKPKYITSSFIYNQERADDYAKYQLSLLNIIQKTLSFNSQLIPHIDVGKVITLTSDYYKYDRERFIVQGFTITLGNSQMSINASNISELPYYNQG